MHYLIPWMIEDECVILNEAWKTLLIPITDGRLAEMKQASVREDNLISSDMARSQPDVRININKLLLEKWYLRRARNVIFDEGAIP